jgi:hypothetical protein
LFRQTPADDHSSRVAPRASIITAGTAATTSGHILGRLAVGIGAVVAVALASGQAVTDAASPAAKVKIEIHDHRTPGHGWFLEVAVSSTRLSLKSVMLWVEECEQTVRAQDVPVAPDGSFAVERSLAISGGQGEGTWRLSGRFVGPSRLEGAYDMASPTCATGQRLFRSAAGEAHSHHRSGTRPGSYPDLSRAKGRRRAEARRLWKRTVASARTARFRTFTRARRAGYKLALDARSWPRPLVFHLRNRRYDGDGDVLDSRRPESLVYWWPVIGDPVLLGYMYRAPGSKTPALARPLLGWHAHKRSGAGSQMTHVWLTRGLRSALANCLPVQALQIAIPTFRYEKTRAGGSGPETRPCPPQ